MILRQKFNKNSGKKFKSVIENVINRKKSPPIKNTIDPLNDFTRKKRWNWFYYRNNKWFYQRNIIMNNFIIEMYSNSFYYSNTW